MKFKGAFFMLATLVALNASAKVEKANPMDELNPYADDIEEQLEKMDAEYEAATGKSATLMSPLFDMDALMGNGVGCYQRSCKIWLLVDKSRQRAQLHVDGTPIAEGEWKATTGSPGHGTPNFDRSPALPLRIYDKYSSTKFPGGSWNGFGNMPFAVFIKGGFAVHGTTGTAKTGNISKLGTVPLSHGCIRIHPDNAKIFNRLVRANGAAQTWITVQD